MAGKVGGSPWSTAMGVGAITDALCRLWSRLRVHEWPTRVRGGVCTSERNTSTLHFKVIRTIFFELCVSLVIILDKPVHQESTEKPGKGQLSYPIAAQKSIRDRRESRGIAQDWRGLGSQSSARGWDWARLGTKHCAGQRD